MVLTKLVKVLCYDFEMIVLKLESQRDKIEALLNALPYRRPLSPPRLRHVEFVKWGGKASPPYNGFTSDERLHGWQMVKWLIAQKIMEPPGTCDICGARDRAQRHSENYYNPFRTAVVCGPCHRLIHFRFWQWKQWRELCVRNDPAGKKWFSLLEIEQPDIAAHLVRKHGPKVTDLKCSLLFELPSGCEDLLAQMEFPP